MPEYTKRVETELPDYKGQSNNDDRDGISGLSKEKYLLFLEDFFALAHRNSKKNTRLASILSDWPPARRAYASESAISRTPRPWMKNLKNRSWSMTISPLCTKASGGTSILFRHRFLLSALRQMTYLPCKRKGYWGQPAGILVSLKKIGAVTELASAFPSFL